MSSRAAELKRRREGLLTQVAAERRLLTDQHVRIANSLSRADGWLTVARRVTPVAAIAAIALGIVAGPGRIVRMLQAAAVPAFFIRQLLANSGEPAINGLRAVLSLFRRGN